MKIISEHISHKSEAGGVQLNLRNSEAVTAAFEDMQHRIRTDYPKTHLDGVLVQPMVPGGKEIILGGRQDPQFGPVILLGLGGIFVEILDQVVIRVAPIAPGDAREMIEQLRGAPILKGARGHRRSDVAALIEQRASEGSHECHETNYRSRSWRGFGAQTERHER